MCQGCFDHYVADEGFPDVDFLEQQQIIGVALAILHHPDVDVVDGRFDYAKGDLHVPIEDDNYDFEIDDGSVAGAAWNQLTIPHRVVVCAVLNGYQIPDGRRFLIHADGRMVISSLDGFVSEADYSRFVPGCDT